MAQLKQLTYLHLMQPIFMEPDGWFRVLTDALNKIIELRGGEKCSEAFRHTVSSTMTTLNQPLVQIDQALRDENAPSIDFSVIQGALKTALEWAANLVKMLNDDFLTNEAQITTGLDRKTLFEVIREFGRVRHCLESIQTAISKIEAVYEPSKPSFRPPSSSTLFFKPAQLNDIELACKKFLSQPENQAVIQEKSFIIPYLKAIFEANEKEDALNTTARIFLLAAAQCWNEEGVKLLFEKWKDTTERGWGSNAPWGDCRAQLCAFMEKHPKNALDLVTNSFFAFYCTLPAHEKEIYERVATRFYPVAEYEVTGFGRGATGTTLGHPTASYYLNFDMSPKERIAAFRLLWNGVFISLLPELNNFYESDADRIRCHTFKTAKLDPTGAESIMQHMKHHLNTRFLHQLFVTYAQYAKTKTKNLTFTPEIHAHLLSLSQELEAACQPCDNSKRSTNQGMYPDMVVRSRKNLKKKNTARPKKLHQSTSPPLLSGEANPALPYEFKPTGQLPYFGNQFDLQVCELEEGLSQKYLAMQQLLQKYSNASGKSAERSDQFAMFQKEFNGLLDKNPINYQAALKCIQTHRNVAIESDADINKEAWFKRNRKGHSRYLTMLTDIENKLVTAWATDPCALPSFSEYRDLFNQRVDDAIASFKQIPSDENPLVNGMNRQVTAEFLKTEFLDQLRQQLNSDQLAGHVRTLAQPLNDLLGAYQAGLSLENSTPTTAEQNQRKLSL